MTSVPPLLALAQGQKIRLRRMRTPAAHEIALHMEVAKILRDYCRESWRFTHIPSGELRDIRTAVKLKAMGTQRGWPDFILVPPTGLIHCLELKRLGKKLTNDQDSFRIWCLVNEVPHAVAWTLDDVLSVFERWKCLRIEASGARS